ncbi:MAG: hypothetical protein R3F14_26810 [Polyangiaceae bacterium]
MRSFLRKTQRYWAKRPSNTEVVAIPRGYAAGKPIPLVVALHGLGSSPEDFAEGWMQKAADALSVAIVSVSGTEVRRAAQLRVGRGHRARSRAHRARRVEPGRSRDRRAGEDRARRLLAGRADVGGARRALPRQVRGAIAMSPGTRRELRLKGIAGGSLAGHRFVVLVGEGARQCRARARGRRGAARCGR